jgi:hypothetical protein
MLGIGEAASVAATPPLLNQKPQVTGQFVIPLSILLAGFVGYEIHAFVPDGRLDAVVFPDFDTPAMVSLFFYLNIFAKGHAQEESSSATGQQE